MKAHLALAHSTLIMLALTGCGVFDKSNTDATQKLTTNDPAPEPTPAPASCVELGEEDCLARSDCQVQYVGVGCVCAACEPSESCPPCECAPEEDQFAGCFDRDPCEGLDEAICAATDGCEAAYGPNPCALSACIEEPDGTFECPECDETVHYQGCWSIPVVTGCAALSEEQCIVDAACEPIYASEPCPASPCSEEDCPVCDPAITYVGCQDAGPCGTEPGADDGTAPDGT